MKGEGPEKSLAGSLSSSMEGRGKQWHLYGLYGKGYSAEVVIENKVDRRLR